MIYTIIDVETTGSSNRMTEISVFKVLNGEIIDEFTSLVNPEAHIPPNITALTGIDNDLVANAPIFAEVAQNILDITTDAVFVAHNVNFDYNIISNEFKNIGIAFRRKKLCTVRLARTIFPGHKSYSLGKICNDLNINLQNRHRARGDAAATVELFNRMSASENFETAVTNFFKKSSKEATLPPNLSTAKFNEIPNATGIYYFKNKKGEIIYIGKAIDLKKRVLSHFYDKKKKELDLCRETADIDFELSGDEAISLLMEQDAIKKHYPKFNVAAKKTPTSYGILSYTDRSGIVHLSISLSKTISQPSLLFYNTTDARLYLEKLCMEFTLCPKYCHLQENVAECSHHFITNCNGICKKEESVAIYNLRVKQALLAMKETQNKDVIIPQKGRSKSEIGFIVIQQGNYKGYGFMDAAEQANSLDDLENYLVLQKSNYNTHQILKRWMV
jgi:DNA polymerase-3 subunit epsilon